MTLEPIIQLNNYLIHDGNYPLEFVVKNDLMGVKSTITVLAIYSCGKNEKKHVKWVFYFFMLPTHRGTEFIISCFEKIENSTFEELIK